MGLSQTSEVSRREILTIDRVVQTLERFTKPLEELKEWTRRNGYIFLRRRHFEGDGSRTSGLGNCRWAGCGRGGRYNCGGRDNFGRSCGGRGRRTSRCSGSGSNCGSVVVICSMAVGVIIVVRGHILLFKIGKVSITECVRVGGADTATSSTA